MFKKSKKKMATKISNDVENIEVQQSISNIEENDIPPEWNDKNVLNDDDQQELSSTQRESPVMKGPLASSKFQEAFPSSQTLQLKRTKAKSLQQVRTFQTLPTAPKIPDNTNLQRAKEESWRSKGITRNKAIDKVLAKGGLAKAHEELVLAKSKVNSLEEEEDDFSNENHDDEFDDDEYDIQQTNEVVQRLHKDIRKGVKLSNVQSKKEEKEKDQGDAPKLFHELFEKEILYLTGSLTSDQTTVPSLTVRTLLNDRIRTTVADANEMSVLSMRNFSLVSDTFLWCVMFGMRDEGSRLGTKMKRFPAWLMDNCPGITDLGVEMIFGKLKNASLNFCPRITTSMWRARDEAAEILAKREAKFTEAGLTSHLIVSIDLNSTTSTVVNSKVYGASRIVECGIEIAPAFVATNCSLIISGTADQLTALISSENIHLSSILVRVNRLEKLAFVLVPQASGILKRKTTDVKGFTDEIKRREKEIADNLTASYAQQLSDFARKFSVDVKLLMALTNSFVGVEIGGAINDICGQVRTPIDSLEEETFFLFAKAVKNFLASSVVIDIEALSKHLIDHGVVVGREYMRLLMQTGNIVVCESWNDTCNLGVVWQSFACESIVCTVTTLVQATSCIETSMVNSSIRAADAKVNMLHADTKLLSTPFIEKELEKACTIKSDNLDLLEQALANIGLAQFGERTTLVYSKLSEQVPGDDPKHWQQMFEDGPNKIDACKRYTLTTGIISSASNPGMFCWALRRSLEFLGRMGRIVCVSTSHIILEVMPIMEVSVSLSEVETRYLTGLHNKLPNHLQESPGKLNHTAHHYATRIVGLLRTLVGIPANAELPLTSHAGLSEDGEACAWCFYPLSHITSLNSCADFGASAEQTATLLVCKSAAMEHIMDPVKARFLQFMYIPASLRKRAPDQKQSLTIVLAPNEANSSAFILLSDDILQKHAASASSNLPKSNDLPSPEVSTTPVAAPNFATITLVCSQDTEEEPGKVVTYLRAYQNGILIRTFRVVASDVVTFTVSEKRSNAPGNSDEKTPIDSVPTAYPATLTYQQLRGPPFNEKSLLGCKLEARDIKYPSLICVATVKNVRRNDKGKFDIEVYFDGWNDDYNYWAAQDNSDIFPCGYLEWSASENINMGTSNNKRELNGPRGDTKYPNSEKFPWAKFLREHDAKPIPLDFFTAVNAFKISKFKDFITNDRLTNKKATSKSHFQPDPNLCPELDYKSKLFNPRDLIGRKLEAKDLKNPTLIAVASVIDVENDKSSKFGVKVKINFDGWTSIFDYWERPEFSDFHPCGFMEWCSANGISATTGGSRIKAALQGPKNSQKWGNSARFPWGNFLKETSTLGFPANFFSVDQCSKLEKDEDSNENHAIYDDFVPVGQRSELAPCKPSAHSDLAKSKSALLRGDESCFMTVFESPLIPLPDLKEIDLSSLLSLPCSLSSLLFNARWHLICNSIDHPHFVNQSPFIHTTDSPITGVIAAAATLVRLISQSKIFPDTKDETDPVSMSAIFGHNSGVPVQTSVAVLRYIRKVILPRLTDIAVCLATLFHDKFTAGSMMTTASFAVKNKVSNALFRGKPILLEIEEHFKRINDSLLHRESSEVRIEAESLKSLKAKKKGSSSPMKKATQLSKTTEAEQENNDEKLSRDIVVRHFKGHTATNMTVHSPGGNYLCPPHMYHLSKFLEVPGDTYDGLGFLSEDKSLLPFLSLICFAPSDLLEGLDYTTIGNKSFLSKLKVVPLVYNQAAFFERFRHIEALQCPAECLSFDCLSELHKLPNLRIAKLNSCVNYPQMFTLLGLSDAPPETTLIPNVTLSFAKTLVHIDISRVLHRSSHPEGILGPVTENCPNLKIIVANHCGLEKLPSKIGEQLAFLKHLSCRENCMTTLPPTFGLLAKSMTDYLDLSGPDLHYVRIDTAEIPVLAGRLNLESPGTLDHMIDRENKSVDTVLMEGHPGSGVEKATIKVNLPRLSFTELPDEIASFQNLRVLKLDNLLIKEIGPNIEQMKALTHLRLESNSLLSYIDAKMGNLKNLRSLNLQLCNNLKTPPEEIRRKGFQAIFAYFKRLMMGQTLCRRTKLMMVGLGGAGKSSLVMSLMRGETALTNETSAITDGIDIAEWSVYSRESNTGLASYIPPDSAKETDTKIHYSVWDFAGQTVYYNTHQFFLCNRAVYLLLWNARLGHEHAGLEFWLSSITCHAPKAPIVVVATHIDQVERISIPEGAFLKRFPNIRGFHYVSSYSYQGIDVLRNDLINITLGETYMGEAVPHAWLKLEEILLEARKSKKAVMNRTEIAKRAVEVAIYKSDELDEALEFLSNLGTIQFFKNEVLRNRIVINPQWIVDVMTCIISVHGTPITEGRMKHSDIPIIWKPYPVDMHQWMLHLTQEFDLTFPLMASGGGSAETEKINIVPCLLPELEPPLEWPLLDEKRKNEGISESELSYIFKYLPTGLFNRVQVRLFQFCESSSIWKLGSILRKNNHIALFTHDSSSTVKLRVQGPRPGNIIFLVHEVMSSLIRNSFHGVEYDYRIPCPECYDPHFTAARQPQAFLFSAQRVKVATGMKVPFLQCQNCFKVLTMTELRSILPPDDASDFDLHLERTMHDLKGLSISTLNPVSDGTQPAGTLVLLASAKDRQAAITSLQVQTDLNEVGKDDFKVTLIDEPDQIGVGAATFSLKQAILVVVCLSEAFLNDSVCYELLLYTRQILDKPIQLVLLDSPDKTNNNWRKEHPIWLDFAGEVWVGYDKPPTHAAKKMELQNLVSKKVETLLKSVASKKSDEQKRDWPKVFISYCWKNSADAMARSRRAPTQNAIGWMDPRRMKAILEDENDFSCWMDVEQTGEGKLFQDIAQGLMHSKVMVACVSNEYVNSENCCKEFRFAEQVLKVPIIVCVVGTGNAWMKSELGVLAQDKVQLNVQLENPLAIESLIDRISEIVTKAEKNETLTMEEGGGGGAKESTRMQAYQEALELGQRKLLRQIMETASSQGSEDLEDFPHLFLIDLVDPKAQAVEGNEEDGDDDGINNHNLTDIREERAGETMEETDKDHLRLAPGVDGEKSMLSTAGTEDDEALRRELAAHSAEDTSTNDQTLVTGDTNPPPSEKEVALERVQDEKEKDDEDREKKVVADDQDLKKKLDDEERERREKWEKTNGGDGGDAAQPQKPAFDQPEDQFCVKFLCEHEGGWHVVGDDASSPRLPHMDLILSISPYQVRLLALLDHSSVNLRVLSTEEGRAWRRELEQKAQFEVDRASSFASHYLNVRAQLARLVVPPASLALCHLTSGKQLFLCPVHRQGYCRKDGSSGGGEAVEDSAAATGMFTGVDDTTHNYMTVDHIMQAPRKIVRSDTTMDEMSIKRSSRRRKPEQEKEEDKGATSKDFDGKIEVPEKPLPQPISTTSYANDHATSKACNLQ